MLMLMFMFIQFTFVLLFNKYIFSLNSKIYHGLYKKHERISSTTQKISSTTHKNKTYNYNLLKSVQFDIKIYLDLYKKLKRYYKLFTHNVVIVSSFIYLLDFFINTKIIQILQLVISLYYAHCIIKYYTYITNLI